MSFECQSDLKTLKKSLESDKKTNSVLNNDNKDF